MSITRSPVVRDYAGVGAADRRADRRARMLAAGRALWGAGGPAAVTVRGVCAEAGLTPRYFYEHFTYRETLLCAVYDRVAEELVAVLVAAGADTGASLLARLRTAITAMLESIAADPHIHRILTADPAEVAGLRARRTGLVDAVTEVVVAEAAQVVHGPLPDQAVLRKRTQFIVGGVDRVVGAWLADPVDPPGAVATECARSAVAVVAGRA